jgi:hypothetical protein
MYIERVVITPICIYLEASQYSVMHTPSYSTCTPVTVQVDSVTLCSLFNYMFTA